MSGVSFPWVSICHFIWIVFLVIIFNSSSKCLCSTTCSISTMLLHMSEIVFLCWSSCYLQIKRDCPNLSLFYIIPYYINTFPLSLPPSLFSSFPPIPGNAQCLLLAVFKGSNWGQLYARRAPYPMYFLWAPLAVADPLTPKKQTSKTKKLCRSYYTFHLKCFYWEL